jgi:cation diffusion facilitator family transporter
MAANAKLSGAPAPGTPAPGTPGGGAGKSAAAAVSVASNSALILLKVAAGTLTGSVAILTEALHSLIDLIASIVAFFSVRKADEPADADHPYGHEKIEHLAAAIEGMLILVGSGVIVFEAVRRLITGGQVERLGFGIGVVALSIVVNLVVSGWLFARARATGSAALEADAEHLRTDMVSSVGVLVGLVLVVVTDAQWVDPVVALLVAAWISVAGLRILRQASRVLVDEALPQDELDAISDEVARFAARGVVGFHALRARRAGNHRHIDMHVQFRAGTSLEDAHRTSHALQDAITARLGNSEVLIHLEPEDRLRPGQGLLTV